MENFYQKSMTFLKEKDPALFEIVQKSEDSDLISITESKAGGKVPAVRKNGGEIYIHSRFDPYKEAERFVSETDPSSFDLFVIFGFGFAYHVEELLKHVKENSAILIIDREASIIKAALKERDIAGIIKEERIKILVGPDEEAVSEALKGLSSRTVSFLTHRGSFQIDPEYYTNIRNMVKSYLSVKDVNIATLSRFEKIWMSNITRNIREFIGLPGAEIFYEKFKGLPAIVAGAGPSLAGSLEFLRDSINKALIICVDTSYNILVKNNIIPHFCLTVDAQLLNARYFEGCKNDGTIFIADPCAHPSVFRLINGRKAVFSIPFDMMKWMEEETGVKGELAYGGSVSTNAYDFAKRTGASPVYLTGQDFAFTGSLAHARGAYLDEEVFLKTGRFFNAEMKNRFQLTALPKISVKGISGKNVITNQKLIIFLNWFAKRNDPALVNAGAEGAYIGNIKHMRHDEISFPEPGRNICDLINGIYKNIPESRQNPVKDALLKKCRKIATEIDELIPELRKAEKLSGELNGILRKESGKEKIDYILRRLSEADRLIESKTSLKDMIGFTIQRVIHTITEGYEIDDDDRNLSERQLTAKKSHFLYKGILEGSEFNLKKLDKMIRLLESC